MIKCKKCCNYKDETEFYPNSKKCKHCTCEAVRENRKNNIKHYTEYEAKRYKENPKRKEAIKAYAKTDAGKKSHKKSCKKWEDNNLHKRSANTMVGNAVRDGKILKPKECSICSVSGVRIHGHHEDYSKPLEVIWCCSQCHTDIHKQLNKEENK